MFGAIVAISLSALPRPAAQGGTDDKAMALRQNVVEVSAGENGFGFIVAQRNQRIFLVTACHVVYGGKCGGAPGSPPPQVKISFYIDQGESYGATLLEHDLAHDLALLQVTIPQHFGWERQCLAPSEQEKRGTPVWFVGRDERWYVPVQNGFISSETIRPDRMLDADMPELRPGSSGGPLVTDTGIIGMVLANSADDTRVLTVDWIKSAVQYWGYPWDLDGAQVPPPIQNAEQACTVSVTSNPSGADISIDGIASGEKTPADIKLTPGQSHDLTVTKDKYAPFSRRVDCHSGHLNADLQKGVGDITIRYTGDYGYCSLLLTINIGNKQFSPNSNFFPVHGVVLGQQDFTIQGKISCPAYGWCAASGSGPINVLDGATYNIVWVNNARAQCTVQLQ